jgi:putative transcriptional regulator
MSRTYRSEALAAIHETASDLHDAGVMDRRTLRGFPKCAAVQQFAIVWQDAYRTLRENRSCA